MSRIIALLAGFAFGLPIHGWSQANAGNPFGIKPEGITSPGMRDALNRLQKAGQVEGRRGSLTFFRWAGDQPPRLAHLGLWGAQVDDGVLALTAALPDLEHVSLYETNVTDAGLKPLATLTKLRSLAVAPVNRYEKPGFGPPQWSYPFLEPRSGRPRITGAGLRAFRHVDTLEKLNLLDANLKSADLEVLAAWPKLSELWLPNPVDAETVKHLQACRRLSSLTIGYREVGAAELEQLAGWKPLRKLTLIHAELSNEALGAFEKLEGLQELHLEACGLTDQRLEHLRTGPNLSHLALERNEINGPGLVHLAKLRLTTLGLEFNNLSDATLSHLTQLTTLEELWLAYCRQITDEGIRSGILQRMTHLKQLRLRGLKQVTDASLDDLVKFGHLQHLTIRETGISLEGVARMKEAMPGTVVFK